MVFGRNYFKTYMSNIKIYLKGAMNNGIFIKLCDCDFSVDFDSQH